MHCAPPPFTRRSAGDQAAIGCSSQALTKPHLQAVSGLTLFLSPSLCCGPYADLGGTRQQCLLHTPRLLGMRGPLSPHPQDPVTKHPSNLHTEPNIETKRTPKLRHSLTDPTLTSQGKKPKSQDSGTASQTPCFKGQTQASHKPDSYVDPFTMSRSWCGHDSIASGV